MFLEDKRDTNGMMKWKYEARCRIASTIECTILSRLLLPLLLCPLSSVHSRLCLCILRRATRQLPPRLLYLSCLLRSCLNVSTSISTLIQQAHLVSPHLTSRLQLDLTTDNFLIDRPAEFLLAPHVVATRVRRILSIPAPLFMQRLNKRFHQ